MNRKKEKKKKSIFRQEVERDVNTFRRLPFPKKIGFLFDYYKWYILLALTIMIILVTFAKIFYEGNRPYRLQVCAVLNTEKDCKPWFKKFEKELASDGKPYGINLNTDQPFDYDNSYYYLYEIEVQTSVASHRMDVAICGQDMYDYLLLMNACYDLDQLLTDTELQELESSDMLVSSLANRKMKDDGSYDDSEAIEGHFAIDISNTSFGKAYNDDGENEEPLYAVLIINTKNKEDGLHLLRRISE